jgi:hypothetical protein
MFRSVGAVIFGIASDRYGRKWPFVINNLLFIALELVSRDLDFCFTRINTSSKNALLSSPPSL